MYISSLHDEVRRLLLAHGYTLVYEHSLLVAAQAVKLAERFGVDKTLAEAAALLHDIGAVVPEAERVEFLLCRQIAVLEEEARFPLILHQKVSRVLAGELYGVYDETLLNAIGCHTTLKPGASPLDMVLFVADKLAWDQLGAPPYREAVLRGLDVSLEAGAYAYIGYLLDNRSTLKVVHPWMEEAYKQLSKVQFIRALNENSLDIMRSIPKSDLHSHAGRGGTLSYISQWANVQIAPPTEPFLSLQEMNLWLRDHVKIYCSGLSGYLKRVEAAFAQAKADHIAVLALSFAVDEIDAFGSIKAFATIMDELHGKFAPGTVFLPDLALGYNLNEQYRLDTILDANWFKGIDICNYSNVFTMVELKIMCQKARNANLIRKAHIGEFGGASDVMRYAEELELDQIQHGIAAAESPQIMKWLAKHRIQLNVCPTSNVMLRNTMNYQSHPIRTLFDYGVPVTINTDDLLIFNSTVSQEYFNLFNAGRMNADELNSIREIGLI